MALIDYKDYFNFEAYKKAISDAEKANVDFGTTITNVTKRIKDDYAGIVSELKPYVETLKNFDVNQKNAAKTLVGVGAETSVLTTKLEAQNKVLTDVIATNNLLEKSNNDLKSALKTLETQYNALGNTEEKDIAKKKEILAEVNRITPAIQAQTQVLKAAKVVVDAADGSYNKMAQELKAIGLQLRALPNAFDPLTGKINKNNAEAVQLEKTYIKLNASLKQADAGMGNFFRNVGNYEGAIHKLTEGFGHFGSSLLLAVGIVPGLFGIVQFLEGSIEKFTEAEAATSRLRNTLSNLGQINAFDRLKEKAEALQKEFKTFRADEVLDVFQKLIVYGKLTEKQIDELTPVIINFAAQQRITLAEATDVITRSLEGNSRGLKTYGINLKEVKTEAERFGVIMEQLAPKVEGAAKAFGEETAGQIKATKIEIDLLKEKIGGELQPALLAFYKSISLLLERIPDGFSKLGSSINTFGETIKFNIQLLYQLAKGGAPDAVAFYAVKVAEAKKQQDEFNDSLQRTQAHQIASETATTLSTKSIKEQELTLKAEEERLKSLEKTAKAFNKASQDANKSSTAEGKAATQNLIQQLELVARLKESIEQQKNPLSVGGAGTDTAGTAAAQSARDAAAKKAEEDAKKQLAALLALDKLKEQSEADSLRRIAEDESIILGVRVLALQEYFKEEKAILKQEAEDEIRLNGLTGKQILLARAQAAVKIEALERETKSKIAAIINKAAADEKAQFQKDVSDKKKADEKAKADALKREAYFEDEMIALGDKTSEHLKKNRDAAIKAQKDAFDLFKQSTQDLGQYLGTATSSFLGDLVQNFQDIFNKDIKPGEAFKNWADTAVAAGAVVDDFFHQASDQRIARFEQEKQRELIIAGDNKSAQAKIELEFQKKVAKEKRKQAIADKVAALFTIAVNTYTAIASPANLALLGALTPVILALGLTQAALVIAQPLPQFKTGTKNAPKGYALVDEVGSELIVDKRGRLKELGANKPRLTYLQSGDKVYTHTETKQILSNIETEKIIKETALTSRLSNTIQQGRQAEQIYMMTQAMGFNQSLLESSFENAVKKIPIHQMLFDERGVRERWIKENETKTYLNRFNGI